MGKSKSPKRKKRDVALSYKCPNCPKEYKTKQGLTKHITKKHSEIGIGDGKDGSKGLTPQQEMFCKLYASDREFMGNGTQSYIEAYDVTVGKGEGCQSYEYCKYRAHQLLSNRSILKRINQIFEAGGFNDAHVDKQLEFVLTQNAELNPKMKAIVEYNKLKKRTSERMEHTHVMSDITKMSDDELEAEQKRLEDFFAKK